MELHLTRAAGLNQITSCGVDYVAVNGTRYQRSLLVTPQRLIDDWPVTSLAELDSAHLATILDLEPELVLVGTGARLSFPTAEVMRNLIDAKVGYEVMDTGAACRTYNIVMAEGRRVLAALIVHPG